MLGIKTFTVRATPVLKRLLFEPKKDFGCNTTKLPRHFWVAKKIFGVERGL